MPKNAIKNVSIDYVLPMRMVGRRLVSLIKESCLRNGTGSDPARVLIMEGEGLVALNLQERLETLNYAVIGLTSSVEDAIWLATELQPNLVLMDVRLKGPLTGVQAARLLWQQLQIPIIFVTANADPATLQSVRSIPHYGCIVKPFHSAGLQSVIELALDRRRKELGFLPGAS